MEWVEAARDRLMSWWGGGAGRAVTQLIRRAGLPRSAVACAPPAGCAAHAALALVVMAPRTAARIFPKYDITNLLVMTSFAGTSIWLWKRPHITGTPPGRRFTWVFLGSSTYVLGSILMWAIIRSTVGRHPFVSVTLGLVSGSALAYTAVDYFDYLDRDFEPLADVTDATNNSDDENYDLDM